MRSAAELFEELNAVDESNRIEAKRASDVGKSVMETVIAFANEPGLGGGYLLLGAEWAINDKGDTVYRPAGLSDPDKVQRDLASLCASSLNVALRPEMQLEQVDGRTVLVVFVPEADVTHKPIYKKATGLPGGAYRRIGSTDQRCVDEDLWVLRGQSQPSHGPDVSLLPDARMDDFDPAALAQYRRVRQRLNPNAEELAYSDDELLEALNAVRRVDASLRPTLAGILLFGKPMALRRLLPMVKIDYIRVPGLEWIEDPHERFQSVEIRKPLLLALPLAEATIIDELPKGFQLPEGELHSVQEPIVPRKVIREALDADEVKVLIYARATGAVDNSACRDFSGLDTLAASRVLRRLRDRGLLDKEGSGNGTYYVLAHPGAGAKVASPQLALDMAGAESPHAPTQACNPELATLPAELATLLATLQGRITEDALRQAIVRLCAWAPLTVEQLATLLGKSRDYLRNKHLIPMVSQGQLRFRYPESAKHPHQAYVTPVDAIPREPQR